MVNHLSTIHDYYAELCLVYQAAVLSVERHVLANCTATIASIQHYLSEYAAILPGVHTVLHNIQNLPNRTDASVMSLLYDSVKCGQRSLEDVLERLLWNCNQVLYGHLSAWCVTVCLPTFISLLALLIPVCCILVMICRKRSMCSRLL
jgi:hypothetical protein